MKIDKPTISDGSDISGIDATKIASGTIGTARLGSGTANSTTYLRGDSTWATVASGSPNIELNASPANNNLTISGANAGAIYTLSANTTFTVVSSSGLTTGTLYYFELDLIQNGTGGYTVTFAAGTGATLKMPITSPAIASTASTGRTRITLECQATSATTADWSIKDLRVIA